MRVLEYAALALLITGLVATVGWNITVAALLTVWDTLFPRITHDIRPT